MKMFIRKVKNRLKINNLCEKLREVIKNRNMGDNIGHTGHISPIIRNLKKNTEPASGERATALYLIGIGLYMLKEYTGARYTFKQVLNVMPTFPGTFSALKKAEQMTRYEKSLTPIVS